MDPFQSPDDLDALAIPHPFFAKATSDLRANPNAAPVFSTAALHAARAARATALDASYGPPPAGVVESELTIAMRDGHASVSRVFRPDPAAAVSGPVVVLCFGGGFALGEPRAMAPYARALARLHGASVVCVAYRLAPEYKFPTAVNDVWDAARWVAVNAQSLGGDVTRGFVLGGVSAGANIAAVVAQQTLLQKVGPPITGLWLGVPMVFPDVQKVPMEFRGFFKSREQNAVVPVLSRALFDSMVELYEPDPESDWYCVTNAMNPHTGMPPTYVEVDGMDPLRDDGIIYEKILRNHGVKTRLTAWPGLPHNHSSFFPGEDFGKSAVRDTVKGLAWLLDQEESGDDDIDTAAAIAPASASK